MANLDLQPHFAEFARNIVGFDSEIPTVNGPKPLIYADWVASGRLYKPLEEELLNTYGSFLANTHTEATFTGSFMTRAYHQAKEAIKKHVNASDSDAIILCGSGMTGALAKLQRILGLKCPEQLHSFLDWSRIEKPVVFITHMEHHSNQTSWLESICEVVLIPYDDAGLPDLGQFENLLIQYQNRSLKIASVTACSNVTGVITPFYQIAEIIHRQGGYCFVDFACSAPYVHMDLHPENPLQKLDAIFFSPHKFLGGPGTPGILIFCQSLYHNHIPDQPGGGTVKWTNPWGEHHYVDSIEEREDGGTPPFYQTIKAALAIRLKEKLDPIKIKIREEQLFNRIFDSLSDLEDVHILAGNIRHRIAAFSFFIKDLHYNLGVKLLNDRYGIQMRGGCSCAGTYGHILFGIPIEQSHSICELIDSGDHSQKPGWIRLSIHPVMTDQEIDYILDAIHDIRLNWRTYSGEYHYDVQQNLFFHQSELKTELALHLV